MALESVLRYDGATASISQVFGVLTLEFLPLRPGQSLCRKFCDSHPFVRLPRQFTHFRTVDTMGNDYSPIALQHVNLTVPRGALPLASQFYGEVIGFASDPVPVLQRDSLLW